ncbi:helix-turn-helix domain-containing protein [Streptomyces sp. R11]|uniref:Helix-turn-helix domain-containing protein n=1 Tax=Streptomyces sp. R11 TaxID=3238625 RepID=A0AB39N335_9ACTN
MAAGGSNRLMTPDETAERLAVSKRTLYAKWREWGVPAYKVGKHLRFRERDIDHWIAQQACN